MDEILLRGGHAGEESGKPFGQNHGVEGRESVGPRVRGWMLEGLLLEKLATRIWTMSRDLSIQMVYGASSLNELVIIMPRCSS